VIGAVVWFWLGPHALLYLAFAFGCAGAAVFYLYTRERGEAQHPSLANVNARPE
jgi:hypothetical protein